MRMSRCFLWALVIAIALTLLLPLIFTLTSFAKVRLGSIFGSGVFLILYCGLSLVCAALLENGRAPRLMRSAIGAGAIAAVGGVGTLWLDTWVDETVCQKVLTWPVTWACLVLAIGLMLLPQRSDAWWRQLRRIAILTLVMLAAYICLATTLYPNFRAVPGETTVLGMSRWMYEELAFRMGGTLTFLAGGTVVVTLLTAWMPHLLGSTRPEVARLPCWFKCPRCGEEQEAQTGSSTCRKCGLSIRVEAS